MAEDNSLLLAHFSSWLLTRVKPITAHYYISDVRQYLNWITDHGLDIDQVTHADLQRYVAALSAKTTCAEGDLSTYASATVGRKISAVRAFYSTLCVHGQMASNPAGQLRRPSTLYKRKALRPAAGTMLPALPATQVPGPRLIRDLAILALAAHEQLRIGEIYQLNLSDIDLKAGLVNITGRLPRKAKVFLSQATSQLLSRWLAARNLVAPGRDEAVFISMHWTSGRSTPGTRISKRGLSHILRTHRRIQRN